MHRNIDILKFILSILVILIHVGYANTIPLVRIAVPSFFIISAYLFFSRISLAGNQSINQSINQSRLRRFITRGALLYLFWFAVLLPITIINRGWLYEDLSGVMKSLIIGVFIKNTFAASWYISAYIIAIVIAFFSNNKALLIIGVAANALCLLGSNYIGLVGHIPHIGTFIADKFSAYPPQNTFLAGLLFVYFGKNLGSWLKLSWRILIPLAIVSLVCFFIEDTLLNETYGYRRFNDCYISLCVLAPAVVAICLKSKDIAITDSTSVLLRKASTVYYCSHASVLAILVIFFDLPMSASFAITLLACTLISFALFRLERLSALRWIKYSY